MSGLVNDPGRGDVTAGDGRDVTAGDGREVAAGDGRDVTAGDGRAAIVMVGVGPQNTMVLTRLAARLGDQAPGRRPTVHLVDPHPIGAGAVWRLDQPRDMCMNTLAGAVTMYADDSFTGGGPQAPGPAFQQWCDDLRERRLARVDGVDADRWRADFADELAGIVAWSHPSRALYGAYLTWVAHKAVTDLRALGVRVVEHRARARRVASHDGGLTVTLDDGTLLRAGVVVASPGWVPTAAGPSDAVLQQHLDEASSGVAGGSGPLWVAPASPIDQDLSAIGDGEHVLVRGLGMGFFDVMSQVSIGRGGRFVPRGDAPGHGPLRYLASGREPVLHVGSDRGVPFLAKSRHGALPPASPLVHLRTAIADLRRRPGPFRADLLWPAILRDAVEAHLACLLRVRPDAVVDAEGLRAGLADLPWSTDHQRVQDVLARHLSPADRFDPRAWEFPAQELTFAGPEQWDAFVLTWVTSDLDEADKGPDSPTKAGLWSISSARKVVGDECTFARTDDRGDRALARLSRFGGMLGSGPPAFRTEQLLALVDAGLVHFVGPHTTLSLRDGGFELSSPQVPGSGVRSRVLVDAWMRSPDVRRPADDLMSGLVRDGLVRPLSRTGVDGTPLAQRSPDIHPVTSEVRDRDGRPVKGLLLLGIPVDGARRNSLQAPIPGTDAIGLRSADSAAARALEIVEEAQAPGHADPVDAASAPAPRP